MRYCVPRSVLSDTFAEFRRCGRGERECQVVWISPWQHPNSITGMIHPIHTSHHAGFEIHGEWLNDFWTALTERQVGVRVQVHTHPREAFHSPIDDAWPIVHTPGFLSLVIPNFGAGKIGFDEAFLAELGVNGRFREVSIDHHLVLA